MPASLLRHDRSGIALSSLLGLDAPWPRRSWLSQARREMAKLELAAR